MRVAADGNYWYKKKGNAKKPERVIKFKFERSFFK